MFFDIKIVKPLKTSGFSGFLLLPLSSVKFRQVRFLTLDSKSVREQSPASSNLAVSAKKAPIYISEAHKREVGLWVLLLLLLEGFSFKEFSFYSNAELTAIALAFLLSLFP